MLSRPVNNETILVGVVILGLAFLWAVRRRNQLIRDTVAGTPPPPSGADGGAASPFGRDPHGLPVVLF